MKRCFDFLGSEVSGKGRDRVYVVPVPIEWSTSYRKGASEAPEAILNASNQIELYNCALDIDLEGKGIVTLRAGIESRDDLVSFLKDNKQMLLGAFPCFIGGEHSITPWILDGLDIKDIGIVWLDAHADLRESYLGERESHACAARNSLEHGRIVEIGVRSYSREERDFMEGSDEVAVFKRWSDEARDAVDALPDRIYLSFDYDALDPSILRAVGTPEPGGLMWDEFMEILDFLFRRKDVAAMDAVELCPSSYDEASSYTAARIVYEAVSRHLATGG